MGVTEPSSALWAAVKAIEPWPATDEDALRALASPWEKAAAAFEQTSRTPAGDVQAAWPDIAGAALAVRLGQLNAGAAAIGAEMRAIATGLRGWADVVAHAKSSIARLIAEAEALYVDLGELAAAGHPLDLLQQGSFVRQVASEVRALVDAAAAQISPPGPVTPPEDAFESEFSFDGMRIDASVGTYPDRGLLDLMGLPIESKSGAYAGVSAGVPHGGQPLLEAEAGFGRTYTAPELSHSAGGLTASIQPGLRIGPGADLTIDPGYENGKLSLGFKAGLSPLIGSSLGGKLEVDLDSLSFWD